MSGRLGIRTGWVGTTIVFVGIFSHAQAPSPARPNEAAQSPAQSASPVQVSAQPTPRPARFVVLLDAAHGGDDSGAQLDNSVAEKTVTLALSVQLRSLLAARGFGVVTTRESNVNVEPDLRAQIANHASAAACLSLHASMTGSGVHIFVSSLPPSAPSRFLAWKTAQAAYVTRSLKLASTVNSAIEHSSDSGSGTVPVLLARTSLLGVDSMACPAVAVEVGPIRDSDRSITTEVTDSGYQAQIAQALAAAILEWRTESQSEASAGSGTVRQP